MDVGKGVQEEETERMDNILKLPHNWNSSLQFSQILPRTWEGTPQG